MNGKRSHEEDAVTNDETEGVPISKKPKTTPNGIMHTSDNGDSPNSISNESDTTQSLQNGYSEDSKSKELMEVKTGKSEKESGVIIKTERFAAESQSKSRHATDGLLGDQSENGLPDNEVKSQDEMNHSEPTKTDSDTTRTLDLKTTSERSKLTLDPAKLKKEPNCDSTKEGEPEIITLSDSEDEFQEVAQACCLLCSGTSAWDRLSVCGGVPAPG